METLQELVAQRRGYKYLDKNGKSPYQEYVYDLTSKRQMKVGALDTDLSHDCGPGWNLATLKWIGNNCLKLDGVIAECSIPSKANIIVPTGSDGKFRTDIIRIKKVHSVESLFPLLKNINQKLKDFKPKNPIMAEKMPPKSKIMEILAQVWDQVGAQVRDQVGAQVRAQVGAQVRAQVGAQVRAQAWAQVWDQVGDQVWVCAYHAIIEFFGLDYDHPAFEFIRLGIIVIKVVGKFKVFGKNGKFLGEFDE